MRVPSILAKCWAGLLPHDKTGHGHGDGASIVSKRDLHLPLPAVVIVPAKNANPYMYAAENVDLQGINKFKGRVSVADIIGFSSLKIIRSKPDRSLTAWGSSIDLVNSLMHEIRDGHFSFRGERVLELACGHGLAGILACLKGASTVHFQDPSAETIRCTTIPNLLANLQQARDRQSRQFPLTQSRQQLSPDAHFYVGNWEELTTIPSVVKMDSSSPPPATNLSFPEEDFLRVGGQEASSRRLSCTCAWERGNEVDSGDGGYDIILVAEIPYSVNSLKKMYALITKCLRPSGVVYVAAKKSFIDAHGGALHLKSLVDEEGIFGTDIVFESAERETRRFFFN